MIDWCLDDFVVARSENTPFELPNGRFSLGWIESSGGFLASVKIEIDVRFRCRLRSAIHSFRVKRTIALHNAGTITPDL